MGAGIEMGPLASAACLVVSPCRHRTRFGRPLRRHDLKDIPIRIAEKESRKGRWPKRLDQLRPLGRQPPAQLWESRFRKGQRNVPAELLLERRCGKILHLDQVQFLSGRYLQPRGRAANIIGSFNRTPVESAYEESQRS